MAKYLSEEQTQIMLDFLKEYIDEGDEILYKLLKKVAGVLVEVVNLSLNKRQVLQLQLADFLQVLLLPIKLPLKCFQIYYFHISIQHHLFQ